MRTRRHVGKVWWDGIGGRPWFSAAPLPGIGFSRLRYGSRTLETGQTVVRGDLGLLDKLAKRFVICDGKVSLV